MKASPAKKENAGAGENMLSTAFGPQAVVRWILGALLILAAISKFLDRSGFAESIESYQLRLPASIVHAIAVGLPCIEMICGLMLVLKIQLRAALLCALLLFAIFTAVTAQAWGRGLQISCGCVKLEVFGFSGAGWATVDRFLESAPFACARAVLLLAATAWLFARRGRDRIDGAAVDANPR
jgi:uncharacterized membrane protein YphA (DoxX/SURF4 family)